MIGRRALLVSGLIGAAGSLAELPPAEAAGTTELRLQHSSLQYSDTAGEHLRDAERLFTHARRAGNVFVSGTESGPANSLHAQIPAAAHRHGYAIELAGGTWVAVDRRFGAIVARGFLPVFPELAHRHPPAGIVWIRVRPRNRRIAPAVSYGSSHWLTRRALRASGIRSNRRLARAVDRWAIRHGRGRSLVFYGADVNLDDRSRDAFAGGPLTTCWDELRTWPGTRVTGRTIDVLASLDWDARVSCRRARRLADRDLFLYSDHDTIEAGYRIELLP